MPRSVISFSSNEQRSKPLDGARLVNLYPETPPLGSRAPSLTIGVNNPLKAVLYGTPGQGNAVTAGSGKIRASREALGYLWVLSDGGLYRVDSLGTATLCTGDPIDSAGNAMMTDNGLQLVVLANGTSYVAGEVRSNFSFTITGGDLNPGVVKVSSITVNSVTITSAAVDWIESNEQTAANVAANINAHTSSPDYTATANGATVTVFAATGTGVGPNGFAVVVTIAGSMTARPFKSATSTEGVMGGGSTGPTVVTKITSSAYPTEGASSVDYMDGYVIWSRTGTRQFFLSAPYDATTIYALDFASAESTPSNLLRVLVHNRELWLFKGKGIEPWADTGASPFPFERINGATMELGCGAALSAAKSDNAIYWLGNDYVVYTAAGYSPQPISNKAMEEIIRKAAADVGVSDAFGMTYTQGGHQFYVLTLPMAGRTLVCDITEGFAWHERQSGTTLVPARWAVNCITSAFGKLFAGASGGLVAELDLDTYEDNGEPIRRAVVTPPFYNEGLKAVHTFIEIECETGVGLNEGQGSDPEVMLRFSDDGGKSWSNERRAALGRTGDRKRRVRFRRLGSFRQRCYEISISDPVKVSAYGLSFNGMRLAA